MSATQLGTQENIDGTLYIERAPCASLGVTWPTHCEWNYMVDMMILLSQPDRGWTAVSEISKSSP